MCRVKTNQRITTLFNMLVSVLASVIVGTVLGSIIHQEWVVVGCVSVTAVLCEHYLTLYPLFLLKYITLPVPVEEPKTQKGRKKVCKK